MMMLTGVHVYRLDRKGRLVIPASHREALGDPLYLAFGPEATVLILPADHAANLDPSLVYPAEVDPTTGRVLIPAALREWAGLSPHAEVAVCGEGDRVTVLPWGRCLAALREQRAARCVPWHLPELAALYVENAALRQTVRGYESAYAELPEARAGLYVGVGR